MDWIDQIKLEIDRNNKTEVFAKENIDSIYGEFFDLAMKEAKRLNGAFFKGEEKCIVSELKKPESFKVEVIGENKTSSMIVSFYQEQIIKITRRLNNSDTPLPETIAVRYEYNGYKITFEPEHFDGLLDTSSIENQHISKMLVEPVFRDAYNLNQISYYDDKLGFNFS